MSTAVRLAPELTPMMPGVCQWVFHHSLQQHAGYSGCRSAEDGDEDAGKPQVINGRHVFVIFNKESFEQLQGGSPSGCRC